jgi:hypothetical protein
VGDGGTVLNGTMHGGLTKEENQVHFGGWCIVSSPLVLAFNLSDPVRRELVWDVITNKEAIQINQVWRLSQFEIFDHATFNRRPPHSPMCGHVDDRWCTRPPCGHVDGSCSIAITTLIDGALVKFGVCPR